MRKKQTNTLDRYFGTSKECLLQCKKAKQLPKASLCRQQKMLSLKKCTFPTVEVDRDVTDLYPPVSILSYGVLTYPNQAPMRQYQFDILMNCIYHNTLVILPTGLGKTFIAAVAMLNYNNWFPTGKIIFMAPNKNLVLQQMEAVESITSINGCFVMGEVIPEKRKNLWSNNTIFFATPQTVENDINNGFFNPADVILLIADECHHATGKYSYNQIIQCVSERTAQFRVIGLSATPGNDAESIQKIIQNLMIEKIAFRDENDPSVSEFLHKRGIEIIKVPVCNDDNLLIKQLTTIINNVAKPLVSNGILKSAKTKGSIFVAMKNYRDCTVERSPAFFKFLGDFGALYSLASLREKAITYGTKQLQSGIISFQKKQNTESRRAIIDTTEFQQLLHMISNQSQEKMIPKGRLLLDILNNFFQKEPNSRVIVFANLREAVQQIVELLKQSSKIIPAEFVGQGLGVSQKLQKSIINFFRMGKINTIVSTCVGEEGLDVGEVDLVVCLDVPASPLSSIQRVGRTARKREGKVIYLVTEGFEESRLKRLLSNTQSVGDILRNPNKYGIQFFQQHENCIQIPENLRIVEKQLGQTKISSGEKTDLCIQETLALHQKYGKMKYRNLSLRMSMTGGKSLQSSILNLLCHEEQKSELVYISDDDLAFDVESVISRMEELIYSNDDIEIEF